MSAVCTRFPSRRSWAAVIFERANCSARNFLICRGSIPPGAGQADECDASIPGPRDVQDWQKNAVHAISRAWMMAETCVSIDFPENKPSLSLCVEGLPQHDVMGAESEKPGPLARDRRAMKRENSNK